MNKKTVINHNNCDDPSSNVDHTIHLDGVSGFVFSVKDEGQKITISGWNNNHLRYEDGQSVLLVRDDGTETRYKFEKITHCGDPRDQYFADCLFYPRD